MARMPTCTSGTVWLAMAECCVPEKPDEGEIVVGPRSAAWTFGSGSWKRLAPYTTRTVDGTEQYFDPVSASWVDVADGSSSSGSHGPVVVNVELPRDLL